jgi:hypothetical protein
METFEPDENGNVADPVKHFLKQENGIVEETPAYTVPDTERSDFTGGNFSIAIEDYNGQDISVPYKGYKREQPVYLIDGVYLLEIGLLYNVANGVFYP